MSLRFIEDSLRRANIHRRRNVRWIGAAFVLRYAPASPNKADYCCDPVAEVLADGGVWRARRVNGALSKGARRVLRRVERRVRGRGYERRRRGGTEVVQ